MGNVQNQLEDNFGEWPFMDTPLHWDFVYVYVWIVNRAFQELNDSQKLHEGEEVFLTQSNKGLLDIVEDALDCICLIVVFVNCQLTAHEVLSTVPRRPPLSH